MPSYPLATVHEYNPQPTMRSPLQPIVTILSYVATTATTAIGHANHSM